MPGDTDLDSDQSLDNLGQLESSVPGRTRFRVKQELRTPEGMAQIQQQLTDHEDVSSVTMNPRTGSVVITHAKHRRAEELLMEALQETELVAGAVLDLPDDDESDSGGNRFGKLDQQVADLLYKIDLVVYQKTGLKFRGQVLAGSIAGLGVAQIALFGISLEMLPGPFLLWIAWDIYHRMSKEPQFADRTEGDIATDAEVLDEAAPPA